MGEQKKLIRPLLQIFKGYRILVLGDREFHSIKLANWLHSKGIDFVLRQKQGTYIRQGNQSYQRLQSLGLNPGISFFLMGIQATKQKGFAQFNLPFSLIVQQRRIFDKPFGCLRCNAA